MAKELFFTGFSTVLQTEKLLLTQKINFYFLGWAFILLFNFYVCVIVPHYHSIVVFISEILFNLFKPFIGERSIQYLNSFEGQQFRRRTDPCLSHQACCKLLPRLVKVYTYSYIHPKRKWLNWSQWSSLVDS